MAPAPTGLIVQAPGMMQHTPMQRARAAPDAKMLAPALFILLLALSQPAAGAKPDRPTASSNETCELLGCAKCAAENNATLECAACLPSFKLNNGVCGAKGRGQLQGLGGRSADASDFCMQGLELCTNDNPPLGTPSCSLPRQLGRVA